MILLLLKTKVFNNLHYIDYRKKFKARNMSLNKTLDKYSKSNMYPFHMPGHKRMLEGCYKIDMTEVDGVDDLHDPKGVISYEQKRLAKIYKADYAFMLVGGSTVGNLSAIYACLQDKDHILIQRNSHKSVYNGAILRHLKIDYIYPEMDENGIYKACTLEEIKKAVDETANMPKAIIITSPTYEGYLCDVEKIADYCHGKGIILIVDEAHGAHLGLHDSFKCQAAAFADATIMSLHKTLPCLTQTAALFINKGLVDIDKIRDAIDIFETSSPSYVLMNSISVCLDIISKPKDIFANYVDNLIEFYNKCAKLKHLKIINTKEEYKDPGKIIISTRNSDISGVELARILREKYEIETELSSFSYTLAMTSIMDSKIGFERLINALLEIDKDLKTGIIKVPLNDLVDTRKKLEIWEAKALNSKEMNINDSEGSICASMVCLYPPGSPLVVPGEIISKNVIEIINDAIRNGIHVTGISKDRICVVN